MLRGEEGDELVARLLAQLGILQSELEHAAHPARELIRHRLVDAEHLAMTRTGICCAYSLGRVGGTGRDEAVDERAAEVTRVRLVLRDRLR